MLAVGNAVFLGLVKSLNTVIQLRPGPAVGLFGLENTRAEELGDVLQFVCGKAQQELARFASLLVGNYRAERLNQDCLHGR